ncbi:5'-nucleotidase [Flavobacterium akiainvivens]|uniref:5'-nucleotidase n=1 Tax=Flavobacterium akiainvivens TaxID=1202724 RepID=A0A0M9VJQ8_9FLAO|nr:5'-nucleotidase [Flavobacterium akiainvivens]KOS08040.1 5'-nucleotidase [Flavobacterium akiainvivens]SFQ62263.1 5'-nucleotidase, C-terminal domain [Flavobacterium akiainvivens]
MPIPKKYKTTASRFVSFLTISLLIACGSTKKWNNTVIDGKKIAITDHYTPVPEIESFIKPYREHINKDLDSVLAYCPETLDKSNSINGWQTTIGNLMADVTFQYADKALMARENRHVNVCLLNHGGIRAIISKGNVTTRTAFEIMPFENSTVVIALKGEQLMEIARYLAKEKKPHPLSGMEVHLSRDGAVTSVSVQGEPVEPEKIYNVATSDYLANGGDEMTFFAKGVATYDLDYKLRNLMIDYFKDIDTLPVTRTERIIQDK